MKYIPTSVEKGLKGGVVYHDGQFDDSRMAVNLAQTCVENGGTVVNQATVTGIVHDAAGRAAGVKFVDNLTGEEHTLKARSVVNAAGCFVDDIMHMDSPTHRKMGTPSQGVHLVLDMKFLQLSLIHISRSSRRRSESDFISSTSRVSGLAATRRR